MTVPEHLTVRYSHVRNWKVEMTFKMDGGVRRYIDEKGGTTVATILDGDKIVARGRAKCHPRENYNKRLGRAIALGRALKALEDRT